MGSLASWLWDESPEAVNVHYFRKCAGLSSRYKNVSRVTILLLRRLSRDRIFMHVLSLVNRKILIFDANI